MRGIRTIALGLAWSGLMIMSGWTEITGTRTVSLASRWPADPTIRVTIVLSGDPGEAVVRETMPAGLVPSQIRLSGVLQDGVIEWRRTISRAGATTQVGYSLTLPNLDTGTLPLSGTVNGSELKGIPSFDPKIINPGVQTPIDSGLRYDYQLYLPFFYPAASRPWPLLFFLHGAGERGSDLNQVKANGPPKIVEDPISKQTLFGGDSPFIVVSPQCAAGRSWETQPLFEILQQVLQNYNIDRSRVYVSGLSMGGYGTWAFSGDYPDWVAAAIPICGFGPANIQGLVKVPIWTFHGESDSTVPISATRTLVNQVKALGGDVTFTSYPGVDHDSWTRTYNNPEIYTWLLAHSKTAAAVETWEIFE